MRAQIMPEDCDNGVTTIASFMSRRKLAPTCPCYE